MRRCRCQSQLNLPIALADTCIYNLVGSETGFQSRLDLTTADAIGTQSSFTDDAQHLGVGIRLDGIVNHEAFVFRYLCIDGMERCSQQLRVIIVERCLYPFKFVYRKYTLHVLVLCLCVVLVVEQIVAQ